MSYSGQGDTDDDRFTWSETDGQHRWETVPVGPTGPTGPAGGVIVQAGFTEVAADTSTSSNVFVDLLTLPITTAGASRLMIHATFAATVSIALGTAFFRITVDGAAVRGCGNQLVALLEPQSGALVVRTGLLAAGPHTVRLQWRVSSVVSVLQIRPVAAPDSEHGSLFVAEIV